MCLPLRMTLIFSVDESHQARLVLSSAIPLLNHWLSIDDNDSSTKLAECTREHSARKLGNDLLHHKAQLRLFPALYQESKDDPA